MSNFYFSFYHINIITKLHRAVFSFHPDINVYVKYKSNALLLILKAAFKVEILVVRNYITLE